jgi:hypothetical protein
MTSAKGQTDFGSPYSLFGPGTPFQRQTVSQAGMGGSGSAFFDLYRQNLLNPAVQAYHADPIFEFGGRLDRTTYGSNEGSFAATAFKINNISMSFPIMRNRMGLTIGIVPYTSLGYDVTASSAEGSTDTPFTANYRGEGGISRAFIGTGLKLFDKVDSANNVTALAIGGNMNFNFGTIENLRQMGFPEDLQNLGLSATEKILMRDASFEVGAHFQTNIVKRSIDSPKYLKLLLSTVYDLGGDMNSELSETITNIRFASNGGVAVGDTLSFFDRSKGTLTLPGKLTLGMGLDYVNDKRQRIRFAFDYSVQEWSAYRISYENSSRGFDFEDSHTIKTGIEFTPSLSSLNFLERVTYRTGFRYEETSLNIRNTRISDIGISFGASIPMHFQRNTTQSSVNFGTEFGRYGTKENGLIQEDYMRFYIGLSLTPNFRNRWFVQQKYD